MTQRTTNRHTTPLRAETINMSHGSGGKDMRDLIEQVFVDTFANEQLSLLEDQATFPLSALSSYGDRLTFTTDSYVVDPLFFPGGNIGTLAVNGTVNDLSVSGAVPLYLSCSMIIEEGFSVEQLRQIVTSMKEAADAASVAIVTGDTKVVERGAADKIFINTAGVGVIAAGIDVSSRRAEPGDVILLNGYLGDHGAAIIGARNDLAMQNHIQSDCAALNGLIAAMIAVCPNIKSMRDATRGGLATVLNEIATHSNVCIGIDETAVPVREDVRGLCEILGMDPLYLANEGKIVAIVPPEYAVRLLDVMRQHKFGADSKIIGTVLAAPERTVILRTSFGGQRLVDMLIGEQLPRIC